MSCRAPLRNRVAVLLALAISPAACTDLPTGTDAFQLEADGELWTAIVAPADLPAMATWLRNSHAAIDDEALERVVALEQEGRRARASGELDRAAQLSREAAEAAVSLAEGSVRIPLIGGMQAIESWVRGVTTTIELTEAPELAAAVERVESERAAAAAALAEGNEAAAAVHLTLAAEEARAWSPEGVALRVLDRIETRLANVDGAGGPRAQHLIRGARQELTEGESLRAVQRALYALQLAGGNELPGLPDDTHTRCAQDPC